MAKITHDAGAQSLILELHTYDSFEDIKEALLDHCEKTMANNAPQIVVEYPVYINPVYQKGPLTHIGYVKLGYDAEETVYTIQHFTKERQELHDDWHPTAFYSGDYGLKPEQDAEV